MGQKQKTEEKNKEERKLVITMASYALNATSCGARKAAWANWLIDTRAELEHKNSYLTALCDLLVCLHSRKQSLDKQ